MVVWVKNNLLPERKYILDFFLNYVFGLNYELKFHNQPFYILDFGKKQISISDNFFYKFSSSADYLKEKNLPKQIFYSEDDLFPEKDLPVIYGGKKIFKAENKISCEIDIFASAFLLLTRWEEYVKKTRDFHNRFDEEVSLLVKYRLWQRPIVNEYIELLKSCFSFLGINISYPFEYQVFISHDIDHSTKFHSFVSFSRDFLKQLLKKKNFNHAKDIAKLYVNYLKGKENDPLDTFDYLMDISEKYGTKSHFYFMPAHKKDSFAFYNYNDKSIKQYIKKIKNRGHFIGIHGSYDSYNDEQLYREQKQRFEKLYGKVTENRQHFLRFSVPLTWDILDKNGIELDSSIGFVNKAGFRSGICFPYPVFDIIQRKQLKIKELPLIVMEAGLLNETRDKDKFLKKIEKLKKTVKKYNGTFVLNWHNSSFYFPELELIRNIYEDVIKIITNH